MFPGCTLPLSPCSHPVSQAITLLPCISTVFPSVVAITIPTHTDIALVIPHIFLESPSAESIYTTGNQAFSLVAPLSHPTRVPLEDVRSRAWLLSRLFLWFICSVALYCRQRLGGESEPSHHTTIVSRDVPIKRSIISDR